MSARTLPLVKLNLPNGPGAVVTVDGVALTQVTAVAVRAQAQRPVSITLDVFGDFAMPEQQAEVLMRVTGLDDARFELAALSGTAQARGVRGAIAVLAWLAATDRPKSLVETVKDALGPA